MTEINKDAPESITINFGSDFTYVITDIYYAEFDKSMSGNANDILYDISVRVKAGKLLKTKPQTVEQDQQRR